MEKGVILLSGGIDSATTLYFAKKRGCQLTALIFDYNQRHKKEIECARRIAQLNRIKYIIEKINLSWAKSSLTDRRIKVPVNRNLNKKEIPLTYVPGRNIIFLSYAFSLAESIGAKKIFIGAHTQDYSGYPDCRPEFLQSFQKAANLGIKSKGIKIIAPLIDKRKKEIIELGIKLKVPFGLTWSCYKGGRFPCERCDSCRFRIEAFKKLRLSDPLNF
ncbi:MAG: 7-cyano-7-deazaguanine synthase QueC [Candidatus Omnitrophica bacterium]|nr:7-cyano-7-deazaguanine synthase QueC [Candidatus Omnitrophota bacterium]MBU0878403.1 7-cyano-7-deazaguanine synthase QueC [Candidatus Omnitrophota bacterium]MBU0897152.1 7-cyano-7-deazaguanine synthase QueC [Candidatus Omnitrophota bacterium]MBU1134490.1 7-cyano-7-deazaguanine synthase QueC [Candidatus Omnitrophota bacterium]MBU1366376.1 7-cyano-7-deazaguanine synthase QueC [Candidatus Omnitrophota bacterium]